MIKKEGGLKWELKEVWALPEVNFFLNSDNSHFTTPLLFKTKQNMSGFYTIILLILSNIFMTLAWYGHLKLQQTGVSSHWPLIGVIAFSWGIAFFEYCCQVPANRIGFQGNGGPFSLVQLKVVQECISLIVFALIANIMFQGETLKWNHLLAFVFIIAAVYLVFK